MDMNHTFWEENSNLQHVKYESCNSNDEALVRNKEGFCCEGTTLNFSTGDEECTDGGYGSFRKVSVRVSRQDPMSHRIIEKRRRDRMNNCLADLSRLIPTEYLKKGRGRVEKTEIIEMAIKHMKHLQYLNHYHLGYQECMSETMRFMVDVEGHYPREPICVKLLGHLQQHCENVCRSTPEMDHPTPQEKSTTNNALHETKIEPNNNEIYDEDEHSQALEESNVIEKNNYKYKNDIKLRFTQDINATKRPKITPRRSTSNQSSSQSTTPTPTTDMDCPTTSNIKRNFSVPVFVLHAKGSFYVPLTLDYQTLLPYLGPYDLLNLANDCILHPVTINVNFRTMKE